MCRICGVYNKKLTSDENLYLVRKMNHAMQHGGPDDEGVFFSDNSSLGLGNRRLSLLDVTTAGHMPMHDGAEKIWVTYNGEVYNFKEIRNQLKLSGHSFKSGTDTEVIIKAYLQWGEEAFNKFNGMFAFALFDSTQNLLYLVRNQNAIKPLYYYYKKGTLIFASEVKAFLATGLTFEENPDWKFLFMVFGHLPEPQTTLKDVKMLPKGHFLKLNTDTGQQSVASFFKPKIHSSLIKDKKTATELIRSSFSEAVKRHMISDAPIGSFLSGGIDSSIISILASGIQNGNLKTLSTVFKETEFNEKKYQDVIINKIGGEHHEFTITGAEFSNNILDIFNAFDQPSTDGINTYFISKYAKQTGLKAVLSGIGADEIFGGYPSFNKRPYINLFKYHPSFAYSFYSLASDFKYKKVEYLNVKDPLSNYLLYRGNFSPSQINKILDIPLNDVYQKLEPYFIEGQTHYLNNFDKTSWLESNLYMQNQLLKDTDAMSMWHSVEVRVPFLDSEFLDAVNQIDSSLKSPDVRGKDLLISAFEDVLPREIWDRPKKGFALPFQHWMKQREITDELLNNKNVHVQHLTTLFIQDKLEWSRFWSLYVMNLFSNKLFTPKKKAPAEFDFA